MPQALKNNRNDCQPFITKDGSEIREIMSPGNSRLERQSLAEATLPAGSATTEHYHDGIEEIYYFLSGKGRMRVDGNTLDVGPGDAVALLPGIPHKTWNTGQDPLVFLCVCVPRYTHEKTILTEHEPG